MFYPVIPLQELDGGPVAGKMSLVDAVTARLLDAIASGEFPEESRLPPESELAHRFEVSRLTVRESVKALASQQLLKSVQGMGTYVLPASQWTSLDALVQVRKGDAVEALAQLVEVRTMIEVGAIELFVRHCTTQDLGRMAEDLADMEKAHAATNVPAFVSADMAFHGRILTGCGNPFVGATFTPISRALTDGRSRTSTVPKIREHAIVKHGIILTALHTGSPQAAGAAMRDHLIQTRDDAKKYLSSSNG